MRSVITLGLGILLAAAAPGLCAQANPANPSAAKPAATAAGKAAPQTGKPAAPAAKKPAAKPATNKVAKVPRPARPVETAVDPDATNQGEEARASRRDPFESLVARQQAQKSISERLPPGKAGLQVSTLRLDGIVRAPSGMIAVVTNPQARTYFLHEGDQLYDGRVEKIAMDGVSFHEIGKDAFGKPVERQVNKRIYSSAGEQQ